MLRTNICSHEGASVIQLKLTRIGNSVGAILPKEALARMHVDAGDTVYLTDAPDGYRITPYDPDFAHQMGVAEGVMKKRRAVLRGLA
jgi:putative addiction module antidote